MVQGCARTWYVSQCSHPPLSGVTLGVWVHTAKRGGRSPFGFVLPLECGGVQLQKWHGLAGKKKNPFQMQQCSAQTVQFLGTQCLLADVPTNPGGQAQPGCVTCRKYTALPVGQYTAVCSMIRWIIKRTHC